MELFIQEGVQTIGLAQGNPSLVSNTDQGTNQGAEYSVKDRILIVIQEEPTLSQKKIADVIGENIVQ